ncbi:M48 family metallopeptidase [Malonomonas rubra]|uniref:M48 metallopeptidase family protein n=1 Tax=Malonomonas rubra TaxID=57040 RepID=UPI0034E94B0A
MAGLDNNNLSGFPKGTLNLNPHLAMSPSECIESSSMSCHITEHSHSDRLYRLVNQIIPNWEQVKTRLVEIASNLLLFLR